MPCRNSDRPRLNITVASTGHARPFRKRLMQKPGKIVIASQHYPPDQSTTAAIMAAIAGHLAVDAPVLVLSGTPASGSHEPVSSGEPTVVEIKNRMPGKSALIRRAIAEILFVLRTFLTLLMKLQRGDVALTVTAPFTLPYAVVAAAKLKRARSALIMHDLFPDVLVMAGLLKPESIVAKAIRAANALMFRALDAVVTIGRDTEQLLLRYRGVTREKIWFIPNWATLAPAVRSIQPDNRYRRLHAARFEDENLEAFLLAANVWLIPYRKNVAGVSVPSRFYNLLAVGRPVIIISEPDAEAALTVKEHRLGWVVAPGRSDELAKAIRLAFSAEDSLMAERAVAIAKGFGIGRAMSGYTELVHGLLRDAKRGGASINSG